MFKILDKALEKRGFIQRSKVQPLLLRAKETEREQVVVEYEAKMKKSEDELNEKHFLEITEKDVEIKRLNQRLTDADNKLRDARKAYHNYKNDVREVNRLISDVVFHVKRLFDKSGEIYQSFVSIQDEAENYLKKLTMDDEENKKLLGINH